MTIRTCKRVQTIIVYLRNKQLMTRIVLIIMNTHEHPNTSELKLFRGFLRKAFIEKHPQRDEKLLESPSRNYEPVS